MMIRNRIALLGISTVIILSLSGCHTGGSDAAAGNSAVSSSEDSKVTAKEEAGADTGEEGPAGDAVTGAGGESEEDTVTNGGDEKAAGESEGGTNNEEETGVSTDESEYLITMESSYKEYPDGGDREVAEIVCEDSDGNIHWQKEVVSQYPATELTQVQEIGLSDGVYYYNWSGTVVALDAKNGDELWVNPDFTGASLQSAFTDDGRIILCGYYGPAFFACSTEGETLARIGEIEDWYWPYRLELEDGYAKIWFDNAEGEGLVRVDLETYEYELIR